MSWFEFKCLIHNLPDNSALARALNPDWRWGITEQLLAGLVDIGAWLKWAKSKAAQDGLPPPPRIPRPGVTTAGDEEVIGSEPIPIDEMHTWLGWD